MKEIWVTTKELSLILGIAQQNVRKKATAHGYITRYVHGRGRGGRVLEFALSSLPSEVQEKYYAMYNAALPDDTTDYIKYETEYSGKQKECAAFRLGVVRRYMSSGKSTAAFVRDFNADNSDVKISEWQLRTWTNRYKAAGHSLDGLIDHRGENRTGSDTIPPDIWEYFLELKLAPQNRSVQLCYDIIKEDFPDIEIPNVKAFERKFGTLPSTLKVNAEGVKDKFELELPSLYRDYSYLKSNDIWSLDHHLSDVFVRNKQGNIVRLWITAAMDVRSRKIMSLVIREQNPDKIAVKQGLRIAIEDYGRPKRIQTDNGKDYLSKDLDPNETNSMLAALGIEKDTAEAYHGQSKPIERFFNTLESNFGKRCYGYAGNNAKKRPDYLNMLAKKLKNDPEIMDEEDFKSACMEWVNNIYANKVHRGDSMNGRTPNQVYEDEMGEIRRFENSMQLAIICGEHEQRTVRHCCIQMYGRTYRPKAENSLVNYNGKKVTLRFLPENLDILYVYDEQNRYICTIGAKIRTPFRSVTMDDLKEIRRERKVAKKVIKEQMPKVRRSIVDGLIEKQVRELDSNQKSDIPGAMIPAESETFSVKKRSSFALFSDYNEENEDKKEVI